MIGYADKNKNSLIWINADLQRELSESYFKLSDFVMLMRKFQEGVTSVNQPMLNSIMNKVGIIFQIHFLENSHPVCANSAFAER
jgi:hypothetical protein